VIKQKERVIVIRGACLIIRMVEYLTNVFPHFLLSHIVLVKITQHDIERACGFPRRAMGSGHHPPRANQRSTTKRKSAVPERCLPLPLALCGILAVHDLLLKVAFFPRSVVNTLPAAIDRVRSWWGIRWWEWRTAKLE
jgi:hypothetical protein